ncbi:RNA-directed DNA polymerase, eukaryota [Tanacetum coccineum]
MYQIHGMTILHYLMRKIDGGVYGLTVFSLDALLPEFGLFVTIPEAMARDLLEIYARLMARCCLRPSSTASHSSSSLTGFLMSHVLLVRELSLSVMEKIGYLGGLWVLLELVNVATCKKLAQHIGVNSWFSVIQPAMVDFVCEERVVWVDIEGIPFVTWWSRDRRVYLVRAKELFAWTPSFIESKDSGYSSDDDSIHGFNNKSGDKRSADVGMDDDSDLEGSQSLKRSLWEYISSLIARWNGESIVMGDFNKVRFEEERPEETLSVLEIICIDNNWINGKAKNQNGLIETPVMKTLISSTALLNKRNTQDSRPKVFLLMGIGLLIRYLLKMCSRSILLHVSNSLMEAAYGVAMNKSPGPTALLLSSSRRYWGDLMDRFLWSERKISWVAWDKTLASKKKGGLGISSFHALNRAMLLKWVWRFISQDGSFWSKLSSKGFNFVARCKKRVGDGRILKFWLMLEILNIPFRLLFPRLFALEVDKEASVASKMGSSSVADSFRRQIRDGSERQQWSDLSVLLQPVILSSSIDRWFCDLNGDGVFRVRDVRISIDDLLLPSSGRPTRWVKFIPIKTNIFIWRARLDRIPTRCNLAIRGVALDSSLCPLCGLVPEDVAHVLFRCEVSQHILRKICRWWDLVWFDVLNFSEWDGWFDSVRLPFKLKLLLEGVFCAAWWHIWVFRNRSIFYVIPPRRSTLFDDIVAWCFSWCGSKCNISISWDCWLKMPYLITL